MPTGYTSDVADGKISSFPDFAMRCARAFGACVTMRDDPSDTAIPDSFAPSPFAADQLAKASALLSRLRAMTEDEMQSAADADNKAKRDSWDRRENQKAITRARYEAMLAAARAWRPPTVDHNSIKTFMIEQLVQSIEHDCGPPLDPRPVPVDRHKWHAEAILKAQSDVTYWTHEHHRAVERTESCNQWLAALRASLQE